MKKSILSLLLVLTMVVSTFAALPMTASADDYMGGLVVYEPFDGAGLHESVVSNQLTVGEDGSITGENKRQTFVAVSGDPLVKKALRMSRGSSSVTVTLPTSYNANSTENDALVKEGTNAKLTAEFDARVTYTSATPSNGVLYTIKVDDGTNNAITISFETDGKIKGTNGTTARVGEVAFANEQWQHYKLTINLTGASAADNTYTLEADGVPVLENYACISTENISRMTINSTNGVTATESAVNADNISIANLSVYKVNEDNPAFSPAALSVLLREIYGKMDDYEASGKGTDELTELKNAYNAAVTALSTSYTTAQTNAIEAQSGIDTALKNLIDAETALENYLATLTYPGGVLLYESFTDIVEVDGTDTLLTPTPQPKDTEATTYRKKVGTDSGAGLGKYAMQHKDNSTTNYSVTIPTAYFAEHTDTSVVTAQGPNAKLTMEFDFKFDGEVPTEAASTLTAVSIGNSSVATGSTGRGNAAVAIYLTAPNEVRFYYNTNSTKYDACYLPKGITFDQWHRYQLAVDLTDENSAGASTYTFTVDGKNLVDAEGAEQTSFTKKLSVNEITKLRLDTTASGYYTRLDNVSVYKTTDTYASLSTAELMTKLHEVNANMALYRAAAAGTSQLAAFETAVANAGTMVTTAFGTYDATTGEAVTPAKTQADVNGVLASLISAEASLKAVLPYYYVISEHNIDETTGEITAVTVEEIKEYTGSPIKLIVATYDTDGLSEVTMRDFAGADDYELTTPLSVTNKLVAVFVWEMNDLVPLANTYYFGEAIDPD